jgi:hypothetical protein
MTFVLELAGFCDLNLGVLAFRQVPGDHLLGLLPLVGAHVHLECFNVVSSIDVEFFSLVILADFSVVPGNLLVIGPGLVSLLTLNQSHSSVPLS